MLKLKKKKLQTTSWINSRPWEPSSHDMYAKALKYSLPLTNPIKNSISSGLLHIKEGAVLQKRWGWGWGTEWWEKNRSIFNFLHGRNVRALISSTWNSKQLWQLWAVPSSYSSPSPAASPAFPRNSRSLLPPLFPSTPHSSRNPVKSICLTPGSSISATASASHSLALTVISAPSSFHFHHLPTSHVESRYFFFPLSPRTESATV